MTDLLTFTEAAARYRKSASAFYEFLRRRRDWLPVTRLGRAIFIDPQTFEAALTQRAAIDQERRARELTRRSFRRAS